MKVEIRITRENQQEEKEVIDLFERLSKSFFPFLVISENKRENRNSVDKSCGWSGTLREFVEIVELRESFGKEPNMDKMVAAFQELLNRKKDAD